MIFLEYMKDMFQVIGEELKDVYQVLISISKSQTESDTSQDCSHFNESNSIIIDGLNKYEIEYLKRLNGKKKTHILDEYWSEVLKDRGNLKKKFIEEELLRPITIEESLNSIAVVDLKKILKEHNLKVSGRKSELIDRILVNLNKKDINRYLEKNIYVISEKGEFIIGKYESELNRRNKIHVLEMSKFICNDKYEEAFHKALDFSNLTGLDWSIRNDNELYKKTKIFYNEEVKTVFREIDWLQLEDLDNTEDYKEIFKNALKYSYISNSGHLGVSSTVSFLDILTKEPFKCTKLENFLLNNEIYLTKIYPYNKSHLNVYVYTIISCIRNNIELRELKTDIDNRPYVKGFKILGCNSENSCDLCKNHNGKKIAWNELHRLPSLPAHYGCRCSYIAWIEE